MSKFKILGLDDLRDHGVNSENDLIKNVIDKFVEDLTLHLLHSHSGEDYELVSRLEEEKEFDGSKWISILKLYDKSWILVEDSDIYLSMDFEVYGNYELDGEFDYAQVNFTKLDLNLMENQFSLIGTAVEEIMDNRIIEWI